MRYLIVLLMSLCTLGWAAPAPLWGPNLFPNPGCEEVDANNHPVGWKLQNGTAKGFVLTTADDACAGKLCLSLERKAVVTPVSTPTGMLASPTIACAPGWYLLAFWHRHEWSGTAQPMHLVYVDRMTGEHAEQRTDSIYMYYFPTEPHPSGTWEYSYLLFRLRPDNTGVCLRFDCGTIGDRLSLDALQLRRLNIPADVKAVPSSVITDGFGVEQVDDPQGTHGKAWQAAEGAQVHGSKIMGGTRHNEGPGLYRLTYRFKQLKAPETAQIILNSNGDGGQVIDDIRPEDFRADGVFQEFTAYLYYPFAGGSFYSWSWQGKGAYRFDSLTVERISDVSGQDGWHLLYDGINTDTILGASNDTPPHAPVWLAQGLYSELTGIDDALRQAGLASTSWQYNGKAVEAMPDPRGAKLIVIADVPVRAFSAPQQFALKRFVENGGGLLVLGGLYGYGHGGLKDSLLADVLPVSTGSTFDLTPVQQTARLADGTALGDVAWVHRVTVKPGGHVAVNAGAAPVVVTGTYGKGRVVAVTGTVLGEPTHPFWATQQWHDELTRLVRWAVGETK